MALWDPEQAPRRAALLQWRTARARFFFRKLRSNYLLDGMCARRNTTPSIQDSYRDGSGCCPRKSHHGPRSLQTNSVPPSSGPTKNKKKKEEEKTSLITRDDTILGMDDRGF